MEKTTDYDRFKMITSNREINEKHLRSMVRNIRENNLLYLNPIVVNEKMEVIDGQHRLEAAKVLKVPVYYIIGSVTEKDISILNKTSRNWQIMDYINYWTIKKKPGFCLLSKFLSEHRNFNISACLVILSPTGSRETDNIRNGTFDNLNYAQAELIAKAIDQLSNHYDFVNDRSFVSAFRKVWDHEAFDFEYLERKLKDGLSRRFVKCRTINEYLDMIGEIYNTDRHSKNHVNFKR